MSVQHQRRSELERNSEGSYTTDEWIACKERYGNRCLRCGKRPPFVVLSADHVVPLTKGGVSYIWNIQPLCKGCNSSKLNKEIDYRGRTEFGPEFQPTLLGEFLVVVERVTPTRFLALRLLYNEGECLSRKIVDHIRKHEVEMSMPSFYQMMSRVEVEELAIGQYTRNAFDNHRERQYQITDIGIFCYEKTVEFYSEL